MDLQTFIYTEKEKESKKRSLYGIIEFDNKFILSNLSSGTSTIPIFGLIVQKGKLPASAFFEEVKALNKVDLPTLGRPTIPHLNPI